MYVWFSFGKLNFCCFSSFQVGLVDLYSSKGGGRELCNKLNVSLGSIGVEILYSSYSYPSRDRAQSSTGENQIASRRGRQFIARTL